MALELGGLLGAIADIKTAISKEKTYKSFLQTINKFGIQVKNNFEVNFSGLEDITFFITDINFSGMTQSFQQVYFNGRAFDIPVVHDYEHSASITVLCDAQGYIYSALTNFLVTNSSSTLVSSGYTLTIKVINGDEDYKGGLVTLTGVRFESVDGLSFGQSSNDLQTFTVNLKYIEFSFTPGQLSTAAGVIGGINSLIS